MGTEWSALAAVIGRGTSEFLNVPPRPCQDSRKNRNTEAGGLDSRRTMIRCCERSWLGSTARKAAIQP